MHAVALVQPMPTVFDRNLYPNLKGNPKEPLEFNYLDMTGNGWPVVMPAHDTITLFRVVAVSLEAARPKLEFDADALLSVPDMPISNAIRVSRTNLLDSKL